MKKFPNLKKKSKELTKQQETAVDAESRITNETVLKHRDQILKKGRQFKYPFHRSKHRIAIISVLLAILSLVMLGGFTGWQLYKKQSTGTFTYRVTQILPFPVATVDGNRVSYESYLFELRSSLHWQEKYGTTDLKSPDGKRQVEYMKRQALDKALMNAIAKQLADKNNISVSDKAVDAAIDRVRAVGGDLKTILADQYGFGESEFRRLKRESLLREKVAQVLDKEAPKKAQQALNTLKEGARFGDVARRFSDHTETKQQGGDFGVVKKGFANVPQEVEEAVFKTKAGQTTGIIKTTSDYYIVQVKKRTGDDQAEIALIRIKVKDLTQYLSEYREQNKINEHIEVSETTQAIEE